MITPVMHFDEKNDWYLLTELEDLIKLELPHIKKVIDDLHSQGLSSGALPQIYNTLFGAVYRNNKASNIHT